jgi:FtsX-like permease family
LILLAAKRVRKQIGFSLVCFIILTTGLTQWISLTSINSSVRTGFDVEVASQASYVGVMNLSGGNNTLPPDIIARVNGLTGIQSMYKVDMFTVYLETKQNLSSGQCAGGCSTPPAGGIFKVNLVLRSVIIGTDGLSPDLIQVFEGHLPSGNESGVALDTDWANVLRNRAIPRAEIGNVLNASINGVVIHPVWTGVGELPDGLLGTVDAFWNATSLRQMIGNESFSKLLNATQPSGIIVKATSLSDASRLASQISTILSQQNLLYNSSNQLGFDVIWDESLAQALQNFESGYGPLYNTVSVAGLVIACSLFLLVADLQLRRGLRESGLLMSQGLSSGQVAKLTTYYFGIIALFSYIASSLISWYLVPREPFSYVHIAGYQQIPAYVVPDSLIAAAVATLGIVALSSILSLWRFRKVEMDRILREY